MWFIMDGRTAHLSSEPIKWPRPDHAESLSAQISGQFAAGATSRANIQRVDISERENTERQSSPNKTIMSEKLQSKLNSSWPLRWNGLAVDVKRTMTSVNAKPMTSCIVEPGLMSTQKPTRNNCRAQADIGL